MPKRPCAIAIEPSKDTSILCADKFGDVYALPLIPKERTTGPNDDPASPSPAPLSRAAKPVFKPAASTSTVHSRRNLESLAMQQRALEKNAYAPKQAGPSFEHTLLLGHISMLTALVLASHGGRNYVVTADRDEHIRVSRSVPQAHVIEAFCFGHAEFVSALTVPPSRPEILVSGGGDAELFVWNWREGRLVGRVNLLDHVLDISEETTKLAVTHLYSETVASHGETTAAVFVLCEE